jgi:hypothetical protein
MRLGVFAAMLPLLLAACARTPAAPPVASVPDTPEVAACRAEARNSPEVRNLARQVNMNNPTQEARVTALRAEAEGRAFNDCLRLRGLSRGGGVERVRPPGF